MRKVVSINRTSDPSTLIAKPDEITVSDGQIFIHDGTTPGGNPLATGGAETPMTLEATGWDTYPEINDPNAETPAQLTIRFSETGYDELILINTTGMSTWASSDTGATWDRAELRLRASILNIHVFPDGRPQTDFTSMAVVPCTGTDHLNGPSYQIWSDQADGIGFVNTNTLRNHNGTTRPTLPNSTRWPTGSLFFDSSLGANGKRDVR